MKNSNTYSSSGYNTGRYNTGSTNVYNNYYYDNTGSTFTNILSHYFLYRALTHDSRPVVIDSNNPSAYAPVYSGFRSILYDIVTFIVLVLIVAFAVFKYKRWKIRKNSLF
jgi:hypothetical protein